MPTLYHSALANHFNQSLLKKRIIMMNTNQSSDNTFWKTLLLIPVLALMIIIGQPLLAQNDSGQVGTLAEGSLEKHFEKAPVIEGEKLFGIIRADLSMETLQTMQAEFKRRGVDLIYSNINFTAKGELSSIYLELLGWNKSLSPSTIKLDNNGKAIQETVTAYLIHDQSEKKVTIGMQKINPSELDFGEDYLEKITGITIITEEGEVYTKGVYKH